MLDHLYVMSPVTGEFIQYQPASPTWAQALQLTLNQIVMEKKFLLNTEPFSVTQIEEYICKMIKNENPFWLAVQDRKVLGWCDVKRLENINLRHTGTLGMGVSLPFRRRGIGKNLTRACLAEAWSSGFDKIELTVYADNEAAISLYRSLGFIEEGRFRRFARIDKNYKDALRMALFKSPDVE
ncbi:MAG: hypothetical protein C5B49_01065 [Bdellovibrio sp.]|nr:MAG: hypothetical protein C5B49_01065 [Bdellovibrio sp.]